MHHDAKKSLDPPPVQAADASSRRRLVLAVRIVTLVLLATTAGLFAVRLWLRRDPAPSEQSPAADVPADPRLTYTGPFRNVRPDVAYVGDAECAKCHEKKSASYHKHPMGRSLAPVAGTAAALRFDATAHNPFDALNATFLVERKGDGIAPRQLARDERGAVVFEADERVDYVLGSGTHGCSYLVNRDGFVFQSPVSWFSAKRIWDKSPGFQVGMRAGRPISGLCLYCHANRSRPIDGTINRYEQPLFDGYAIGCERCHGPGGRHVEDPGHLDPVTEADYTIVNPKHLKPELRAAICEQCHLTGEARFLRRGRQMNDFRPGLPLQEFFAVYVHAADPKAASKAVNHVDQMYQSRCFLKSLEKPAEGQRKLGCVSCHDPHVHVESAERVTYFRDRCLNCHGPHAPVCSEPEAKRLAKNDSCIDCHMPRFDSTDIAHNASTDHRLMRRPTKPAPLVEGPPQLERDFVSFYPNPPGQSDKERDRDLAIGLAKINFKQMHAPPGLWERVVALLQAALDNDADDVEAWETKGMALTFLNYPQDALSAFETALAKSPRREIALSPAAVLAERVNQPDKAIDFLRRILAENPYDATSHAHLAQLLARRKEWTTARRHCEAWVRLDPVDLDAHVLLVSCLAKTGDKDAARAEFAKIERLKPANLPVLQARFSVDLRPARK